MPDDVLAVRHGNYRPALQGDLPGLRVHQGLHGPVRVYCFDIDGTLCHGGTFPWYEDARPDMPMIRQVKRLHEAGHYIKIWTARGSGWDSVEQIRDTTLRQLLAWGVPFHELRFGKPYADVYVDDRAVFAWDFLDRSRHGT